MCIRDSTNWVVFEPNSAVLWSRVTRTIETFLATCWRDGALAGSTPSEAFFVECGPTTMTQDDIDNGRLICQIGIAPVKPCLLYTSVKGPTHTNVIFDAVVPFGFRLSDEEVAKKIRTAVRALDGNYYAVVRVQNAAAMEAESAGDAKDVYKRQRWW